MSVSKHVVAVVYGVIHTIAHVAEHGACTDISQKIEQEGWGGVQYQNLPLVTQGRMPMRPFLGNYILRSHPPGSLDCRDCRISEQGLRLRP